MKFNDLIPLASATTIIYDYWIYPIIRIVDLGFKVLKSTFYIDVVIDSCLLISLLKQIMIIESEQITIL